MIKSMTGYASEQTETEDIAVNIEIRSYNSRYLDIVIKMPHKYICFEDKLKGVISKKVFRGRIEVSISVEEKGDSGSIFVLDRVKAAQFGRVLRDLKEEFDIVPKVSFEFLTGPEKIVKSVEKDASSHINTLKACLEKSLESLWSMKQKEGKNIAEDILEKLAVISNKIENIESACSDLMPYYINRLKERITLLTEGMTASIDPERLAQEAAFMADKSDITEEIVRVKSHISQFKSIIEKGSPAGQKLNFLTQEINRELNTIGVKAGKASASYMIVELKAELEKIREQVQNIE